MVVSVWICGSNIELPAGETIGATISKAALILNIKLPRNWGFVVTADRGEVTDLSEIARDGDEIGVFEPYGQRKEKNQC